MAFIGTHFSRPRLQRRFSPRSIPACKFQPISSVAKVSRRSMLAGMVASAGCLVQLADTSTKAGASPSIQYTVVKSGAGPAAVVGDLVGIRFKGSYNGVVFDNLFNESTPYFYRVGSGAILKGLEDAVLKMKVGDVYDITIPGELAFGTKGRRASAGKPSIPPNATVLYTLELTTIPGKEEELLEGIDSSEIGA